ncbi:hypothetical protein [Vibrio sp. YIC-376]
MSRNAWHSQFKVEFYVYGAVAWLAKSFQFPGTPLYYPKSKRAKLIEIAV